MTMAPRDTRKSTAKVKTVVGRTNTMKSRSSPVTVKKTIPARKLAEKTPMAKVVSTGTRQRTNTVPTVSTPKPKEKLVPVPGSVTKSAKKSTWKRRPKPAHSGVPVPEKMKKLLQQQLMDSDCSL